MAGAAALGLAGGLAVGGIIHHENEQDERLDRLEQEQNHPPPADYGFPNESMAPPADGGTTIIREDGGWFGPDRETIITRDDYGGQTVIEREDGWFDNDVTGKN
ncbi:hypothetical protein BDB01DRAFT_797130 [Pilobolus umbonatus]|nr:hypothetical protein BDB01DRAFT_797130 [Pilobolus umbonatus]